MPRRIDDPGALKALAHPLRVALLAHLVAAGPATASACAEAVGASASNCSWHLRRLAAAGFVEPVDAGDGRERPWRSTDTGFEVVNGCLQLHGGYGYLRDHPIERVLRDLRVHQILEGTNEIMRVIISREMFRQ